MGLDDEAFWRKTPKRIVATLRAQEQLLVREQNWRAWAVWHIEQFRRSGKKFPPLKKLLIKPRQHGRQSWQQQMQIMSMWEAVMRRVTARQSNQKRG